MDAATATLNVDGGRRGDFLSGYLGGAEASGELLMQLERFMLVAVLGYYAFQISNEDQHAWIAERMPRFCATRCNPYLDGERIFSQF